MSPWKLNGAPCTRLAHAWHRCQGHFARVSAGIWYGEQEWGDTLFPVICRSDQTQSVWLRAEKDSEQSPSVCLSTFTVKFYSGTWSPWAQQGWKWAFFLFKFQFPWSVLTNQHREIGITQSLLKGTTGDNVAIFSLWLIDDYVMSV